MGSLRPRGRERHRRGRHGRRGWGGRLSYLGAQCCETPGSCASAPRRAARLRQTALRGPCGAAPTESRARRGCSSERGNRACGHDDGCWAGRCACSREVLLVRGIRMIRITSAAFHGLAVPDPEVNQREETADASGQASLRHRPTTDKTGRPGCPWTTTAGTARGLPNDERRSRRSGLPQPWSPEKPWHLEVSGEAVENLVDQCITGETGRRVRPGARADGSVRLPCNNPTTEGGMA